MVNKNSKNMIAIIGGGISGLTAAYTLKQAGMEVTLFEKSSRLGGAMWSIEKDGYLIETGPNTILETSPKVTEIVTNLGLDAEKIYANEVSKTRYIVRGKKPVPLPMSPLAFIKSSLFSFSTKLRLLKEPFIKAWDNQHEESLAHFVRRRLGQEFLDYAIDPFVAGVYAGDPDELSIQHGFPKLFQLEQNYGSLIKGQIKGTKERKQKEDGSKQTAKLFSFTGGLKTLPEAFERVMGSANQKNSLVEDITQSEKGWDVTFTDHQSMKRVIFADSVVYAGQASTLNTLTIGNEKVEDFGLFKDIYYPPLSVLALGFKREDIKHPLDGFGMLVPKVEGFQILGALFSSTLFSDRAPEGHVLLTVFMGGARQPENVLQTESDQIDMTLEDLKILLDVKGEPTFTHVTTWKKSIPQYNVGYGKFKDQLNHLENQYPGLYFTGNYWNGISVPDTMVNATEVAKRIIMKLEEK